MNVHDEQFRSAIEGLRSGDFSRLAPLFARETIPGGTSQIMKWFEAGLFRGHLAEADEALSCACFLGETETASYLLAQGLNAAGGNSTGTNAIHYAASRGQLGALRVLLAHGAPLEAVNRFGGTTLGQTVWSAVNQPMSGQLEAIEELLRAGADIRQVEFPTADAQVNELLRRFGAV